MLVVGFVAVALWRLEQAIFATGGVQDQSEQIKKRVENGARAVIFAALAIIAVRTALGAGEQGTGQEAAAGALGWPGGQFLVGAVGLVLVAIAVVKAKHGWEKKFLEEMNLPSDQKARAAVERLGQVGSIAKAVALGLIGVLVVVAAVQFDPSKANGLDPALKTLAAQPFGMFLLAIVAVGLAAYGVFCFFDAKSTGCRRPPGAQSGTSLQSASAEHHPGGLEVVREHEDPVGGAVAAERGADARRREPALQHLRRERARHPGDLLQQSERRAGHAGRPAGLSAPSGPSRRSSAARRPSTPSAAGRPGSPRSGPRRRAPAQSPPGCAMPPRTGVTHFKGRPSLWVHDRRISGPSWSSRRRCPVPYPTDRERDRPWVIRTYAGHSSAAKSNALYRRNLAKGQTGLSVAFDLPTQTGYDPDDELARGEVGKVGVPVSHLGDMRALFDGIPLAEANTSMTINAPAMWLLALYVAVAEEQGADRAQLAGTTQNDIVKEYLSRGTYVFPPAPACG